MGKTEKSNFILFARQKGNMGTGLPGLGTEHLPGALCSGRSLASQDTCKGLQGEDSREMPGDGEGQGSLACCSPWGGKESGMTWQLSNNSNCCENLGSLSTMPSRSIATEFGENRKEQLYSFCQAKGKQQASASRTVPPSQE